MTRRERDIIRAALDVLHERDGHQLSDEQLHCATNGRLVSCGKVGATLTEFTGATALADSRGWLTGIVSATSGVRKWSLSDLGDAARHDL